MGDDQMPVSARSSRLSPQAGSSLPSSRMQFNHIAIVGVGLIGGSFALAVRRAGLAKRITGWGGTRSLQLACDGGVIDGVEDAFDSSRISNADLVYLAAPISGITDFLRSRGWLVKPGALVTDAGSTKREVCLAAREGLSPEVDFVGGHPMAGSHNSGLEYATADLFRGAPYAVMVDCQNQSENSALPEPIGQVLEMARAIGASPVMLTPEQHDRIAARISHAPQILSTALALAIAKSNFVDLALALAGSGFSDMARLAESKWSVWEDICRTNADEIATALAVIAREVEVARRSVESGDFDSLAGSFEAANECIERFRETRRNLRK